MQRQRIPAFATAALLLGGLALGSCKKMDAASATPDTVVLASSAALGNFLTDAQNHTLYYFTTDVAGANTCTGGCMDEWPVFFAPAVQAGAGLNAADFTTGRTAAGRNQTFYKGWPLYYFAPVVKGSCVREAPGETLGDGDDDQWYVVSPNHTLLLAEGPVVDKSTGQTATKRYLVDPAGRTLYTFGKDARLPASQPTNCLSGCADAHPVFYSAKVIVPSGLKASDFGTITRTDGAGGSPRLQTTYKGRPLYYYTPDNAVRGKAEGDGYAEGADQWAGATL